MGRDLPDWGALPGPLTVHEVTDLGELAARLGSVVTYHRGGIVVFVDDFANGLTRWTTAIGGAGDVVDLSLVRTLSGPFSARLLAASAVSPIAEIGLELPKQIASRMGGEFAFAVDTTTSIIELTLSQYDGSNLLRATVRYSPVDETLQYLDADGNYVTKATGIALLTEANVFHNMKLVTDLENEEYVKVLLDDTAYSLTDVALRKTASALLERFSMLIWNRGRVGASDTVYVDRVIVTQNEPL
ncbi:hypothetical protein LCGC14_1576360 [marine sediment metagenome]|uniref:Uncharacterized protein n=1 Tax=marine sediment metagenome TaxID=412755 RepID=A0A0F9II58_9ZZZZ